jgi:two-component system chemotaxis response regulator CheY
MKFLVVDDSKLIRSILENRIKQHAQDAEVLEAEDGVKALEILEENQDIRYMFTDWNMPHMNGLELVKAVRKDRRYAHIKIVMATTEGDKTKVIEAAKAGIDAYIVKPFQSDVLKSVFDKLLAD